MKCVMCGSNTVKKNVDYKEFGVFLGNFKADVCQKCGETFFDSDTAGEIQAKSKKMGLFGLSKKTKTAQVGNSLAIRIPKEIAKFINLKKEEEVKITPKSPKEILIEVI